MLRVFVSDSLFVTCSHSRRFIQQRLEFHHCFVVTGRVALSAFPRAEVDDTCHNRFSFHP
jgi:hypothetical protein